LSYSHSEYWRNLHNRMDLSAVGQSSLPADINVWIYRTKARNLKRFTRRHGLVAKKGGRVLEVGVGTGYWLPMWKKFGYRVDGCDLVQVAVDRVQRAHPDGTFWQADVSRPEGILAGGGDHAGQGYDLVTATEVLLHVTKDDEFVRALGNMAAAVKPGGFLLLVEPALTITKKHKPYDPKLSSRARVLRTYRKPLSELGMEFVTVEATTVPASNPIEYSSTRKGRLYRKWWLAVASSRNHPGRARFIGPTMYALDGVLMLTNEAPTSKILLFRRPR
jgi:2-polyprenyl-3-methyl-5-hydroxy-6-metoxy-1,4-benzoquinol methylase